MGFVCVCVCVCARVSCSLFAHVHCLLGAWCKPRIVTIVSLLSLFLSPPPIQLWMSIYRYSGCLSFCLSFSLCSLSLSLSFTPLSAVCLSVFPSYPLIYLPTGCDKLGSIKIQRHIVSGSGLLGRSYGLIEQRTRERERERCKKRNKEKRGEDEQEGCSNRHTYCMSPPHPPPPPPPHPFLHRMAVYCSGLINSARWENYF